MTTGNAAFASFLAGVLRPFDSQLQAVKKQVNDGAQVAAAITTAAANIAARPRIAEMRVEYDVHGRITRVVPIYEGDPHG